jgi:hypothetical protein
MQECFFDNGSEDKEVSMVTFLAVYRGASLSTAELVAVSTDPMLVEHVAGTLLSAQHNMNPIPADPALKALASGKRQALKLYTTKLSSGAEDKPMRVDVEA